MNPLAKAPPGSIVAHLETLPISRFTLALFCGASGDHNPLHMDTDFARPLAMRTCSLMGC